MSEQSVIRRASDQSLIAPRFEAYKDKYENVTFERDAAGVLEMTLGTDGGSLVWSARAHEELSYAFVDVANDRDNAAVILTGAGDAFCADIDAGSFQLATARDWDLTLYDGRRLLTTFLDIEVPIIAAVNGPARIHPEIPVLADVVIAADTAVFQDAPHYMSGIVPGDGAHLVWPNVIGPNRGRYFLLTGQELDARTALDYGAVSEVVPADRLMARTREVAARIADKPFLTRRYGRLAVVHQLKKLLLDGLGYGLALEALAATDQLPTEGRMAQ